MTDRNDATDDNAPPKKDSEVPFRPEAGEIEPAGGIIDRPPVPREEDEPTEGDRR
jgi:hypothetical protein